MKTLNIRRAGISTVLDILGTIGCIALLIVVAFILNHLGAAAELAKANAGSIYDDDLNGWYAFWWVVMGCITAFSFSLLFMTTSEEWQLQAGPDGYWNVLSSHERNLLNVMNVTQTFEEITEVNVSQGMLARMFGIGSITITLIKYLGSEYESYDWTIDGVEDPHRVKELILEALPPSKGPILNLRHAEVS